MQRLSGRQVRELQEALLDAFPARDDLRIMVRVELDEQLEAIADGPNQRVIIFNLVSWADQTGRLDQLVEAAARYNAGNGALQQLARTWRSEAATEPAGAPATKPAGAPATPALPAERSYPAAGRRWLIVGLAAALVVVVGGLGLYLLTQTPLRPGAAGSATDSATGIGNPGGSQAAASAAPTVAPTATAAAPTAAPTVAPTGTAGRTLIAEANLSPTTPLVSPSGTITTNPQDGAGLRLCACRAVHHGIGRTCAGGG